MKVKDGSQFNGLTIKEGDYGYLQKQTAKYLQARAELQGLADRWDRNEITLGEYQNKGNILRYDMQCAHKNIEEIIDLNSGGYNYTAKRIKNELFGDDD